MLTKYIPSIIKEFNNDTLSPNYVNQKITTSDKVNREYKMMDISCELKLTNGSYISVKIFPRSNDDFLCSITDSNIGNDQFYLGSNKSKWFTKIKKAVEKLDYNLFDINEAKKVFNNYIEKVTLK